MTTNARRTGVATRLSPVILLVLAAVLSVGLLPAPAADAQVSALPIQFSDVSVFATNSVRISNGAQVTSGHVVVNSASSGPTLSPGVELGISNNAHTPAGYVVAADSILLSNGAVVGGNAFFNTLSNSGTINGTQNTPLGLPVFTPLPTFKSAPAGTLDVTVASGTVQTIAAGNYRDLKVLNNATLRIDQGVTNVRSITVSNGGKLLFLNLAAGRSEVRVAEQMNVGNNFVVGPVDSDPLKAGKIVFYVASPSTTTVAVETGNGGTLFANVYAPNGTLILDNNTSAVGAFLAKNVDVQNGTTIGLESFFDQQPPAITSANATTFTVGQAGSFTVTTTGLPTPSITRGGVALPSDVTFNDNVNGTGTLSGIPAFGTVGTYAITFTASNGVPPDAVQNFTLTVAKASQTIAFTSTAPGSATAGGPTYNVTATATSGLAVSFTIDPSASAVCSIAGSTVSFTGTGTCVINANQAGNADYNAAPQVQQSFAVGQGAQTISFTSAPPAGAVYQGPTYNVTATATSGLPVTFTIDPSASAVCSIVGSTVSFVGAGTCVINANQAGDANYNPAPQVQQSFAVSKASQTISFTSVPPVMPTVGGATYNVTATATSGLAVTFTIDASASLVCSIVGSTVSFGPNAGTCVINANQAGNANYNPAPQVQQSFGVQKSQTITFTSSPPAMPTVGGPTYNVTATATSGLAVTFTIDASAATVCSIVGSIVSFGPDTGTCVINANQAGNAEYYPAPQVQQSFAVKKAQIITFTSTPPNPAVYQGPTYNVTAVATSGLLVTITIDASATAVCSLAGSTVSFIGAGTCVINANQGGNAEFYPAPQVQQAFAVQPGAVNDAYDALGNVLVDSSSGPGTPFSVTDNDNFPPGATISAFDATSANGGTVTMTTSGANLGRFTYNPPVGFTGADTFTYTLSSGGQTAVGTVTFTVTGKVWFIDNTTGACSSNCDGRLTNPFPDTSAFQAVNSGAAPNPTANDAIFVYSGATTYSGGVTLLSGQRVVGQGASGTLAALGNVTPQNGQSLPITGGAAPILTAGGAVLTVGSGNFIHGLTLGIGSTALSGSNFGALTVNDNVTINTSGQGIDLATGTLNATLNGVTSTGGANNINLNGVAGTGNFGSGALSGGTTTALSIAGQNGSFTYGGTITNTTGSQAVSITGKTGGTVTLSGDINPAGAGRGILVQNNTTGVNTITFSGAQKKISASSGAGVNLATNTAATIDFANGGLQITASTTAAGFSATGGGTVTVGLGAHPNIVSSASGPALNVASTDIGGGGLNFQSISAGSGAGTSGVGISLDTTGTAAGNGGLVVSGTGAAGTGGTIQRKTGANGSTTAGIGIYLNQTKGASFSWMQLNDFDNFAIRGHQLNGLALSNVVVSGLNGNSAADDEGSIFLEDAGGAITISNTSVSGGFEDNLRVRYNNAAAGSAAVFNVSGSTFRDLQAGGSNAQVNLRSTTTASSAWNVTFNFTNSIFENDANTVPPGAGTENFSDGIFATFEGPFPHSLSVLSSTFHHLFQAMDIASNFSADVNYVLKDNIISFTEGAAAIALGSGSSSTSSSFLTGLIQNNTIGISGVPQSGSRLGLGIALDMRGNEIAQFTVHDNKIRRTEVNGIQVIGQTAADGNLDVQITNNLVEEIEDDGGGGAGIVYGIEATTNAGTSHDICLDIRNNNSFNINAHDIRVRQSNVAVTFAIEGLIGSGTSDVDVENYIIAQNPGNTADVRTGGSIVNYTSVANCTTPAIQ